MRPTANFTETCKAHLLALGENQLLDFDEAVHELEEYDWSGTLPLKRHWFFANRYRWRRPMIEISFEVIQHRESPGTLLREIHRFRGVYPVL